eukprot:Nk52_evm1s97 gene=Nk52_evmTU1s97
MFLTSHIKRGVSLAQRGGVSVRGISMTRVSLGEEDKEGGGGSVRTQVLGSYRRLLRACKETFAGDERALKESIANVRAGYREKKDVGGAGPEEVQEMINMAEEVTKVLYTNVLQLEENTKGHMVANIRETTELTDMQSGSKGGGGEGRGDADRDPKTGRLLKRRAGSGLRKKKKRTGDGEE